MDGKDVTKRKLSKDKKREERYDQNVREKRKSKKKRRYPNNG